MTTDHAADAEISRREDVAIATIEATGATHLYTYNPDGVARRFVFDDGSVVIGLTSLESFAHYRATIYEPPHSA